MFRKIWTIAVIATLGACSTEVSNQPTTATSPSLPIALDVYKSPTCGCCVDWIAHLENANYKVTTHHPENIGALKSEYGIPPRLQSCHTAVTRDGYVFEGHIPEKYVKQFLATPPRDAIGLAVPGMPVGSPGMEVGDRFNPYQILLVRTDGQVEVYAEIERSADQYH